jgi:rRNA-processing protein FCF1
MVWNMAKDSNSYILDTSAFISLESINILEQVLKLFSITTTNSVIKELEEFAKHDDKYGKIAKSILRRKSKLKAESCEISESIKYIESTDNELYNLALKNKLPLIADETKLIHHAREKIEVYFSTVFLVLLTESGYLTKQEALNKLEMLRDIRNWRSNIIYLITKSELEKI